MKRKLKLIWYLLTAKAGSFDIGKNKYMGGFYINFNIYGIRPFLIRYKLFIGKWRIKNDRTN